MKHVLVTGGTGFLGGHVVSRLRAEGHHVVVHGRTRKGEGDAAIGDLADPSVADRVLAAHTWDAIINLAGPVTSGNEELATGIDVVAAHARIALQVRRHARSARIVHASSMTVYGMPQQAEVREDAPRKPQHLYALGKVIAEDILLEPSLDTWILRLPGLFSEQRTTGALYHFCRAANAGETVRVTTAVPTPWNILHVEDAAEAIVRAVTSSERAAGAVNVSYGEPVELVAIAERIAALAGKGSRVEHPGVHHPRLLLVADRMRSLLRWSPPSLDDRLARLVAAHAS